MHGICLERSVDGEFVTVEEGRDKLLPVFLAQRVRSGNRSDFRVGEVLHDLGGLEGVLDV